MSTIRKNSKKRNAILELLHSTTAHPNADWIYAQLKPMYPDLSLGTVYRNLAAFRQDGTLTSVGVVNGQERFDAETAPHTHFICSCCGQVCDMFDLVVPEELVNAPSQNDGVRVDHYQLTFQGVCKDCLKKESQAG